MTYDSRFSSRNHLSEGKYEEFIFKCVLSWANNVIGVPTIASDIEKTHYDQWPYHRQLSGWIDFTGGYKPWWKAQSIWNQTVSVSKLLLPVTSWVAMGKFLSFSELYFPYFIKFEKQCLIFRFCLIIKLSYVNEMRLFVPS